MPNKVSVTPEEIAAQREKGWADFHPEDYCHNCGHPNVRCWHAPSDLWNRVADTIRALAPSEIICPQCFTEIYEAATGEICIWELRLDPAR